MNTNYHSKFSKNTFTYFIGNLLFAPISVLIVLQISEGPPVAIASMLLSILFMYFLCFDLYFIFSKKDRLVITDSELIYYSMWGKKRIPITSILNKGILSFYMAFRNIKTLDIKYLNSSNVTKTLSIHNTLNESLENVDGVLTDHLEKLNFTSEYGSKAHKLKQQALRGEGNLFLSYFGAGLLTIFGSVIINFVVAENGMSYVEIWIVTLYILCVITLLITGILDYNKKIPKKLAVILNIVSPLFAVVLFVMMFIYA